jgi:hypothetical protein
MYEEEEEEEEEEEKEEKTSTKMVCTGREELGREQEFITIIEYST